MVPREKQSKATFLMAQRQPSSDGFPDKKQPKATFLMAQRQPSSHGSPRETAKSDVSHGSTPAKLSPFCSYTGMNKMGEAWGSGDPRAGKLRRP
jgi:hypothetical protein